MHFDRMNHITKAATDPWMGVYLRILAIAFAYSAVIHGANIAGLGDAPWLETPLTWRVGDVFYGILDAIATFGLWQKRVWGMAIALFAIASQFVIYTVFIDAFAFTAEQQQTIHQLLIIEGAIVGIFVLLLTISAIKTRWMNQRSE